MYQKLLKNKSLLTKEGLVGMEYLPIGITTEQRKQLHIAALMDIMLEGNSYTEASTAYIQWVYHTSGTPETMSKLLSSNTNDRMIMKWILGQSPTIDIEVAQLINEWLTENKIETPMEVDKFVELYLCICTTSKRISISTVIARLQHTMKVEPDKMEAKILVLSELVYYLSEETKLSAVKTFNDVPYFEGNIKLPEELLAKVKWSGTPAMVPYPVELDEISTGKTRKAYDVLCPETEVYLKYLNTIPFNINPYVLNMDRVIPTTTDDGKELTELDRDILNAGQEQLITLALLMQESEVYFPVKAGSNKRNYSVLKGDKFFRFSVTDSKEHYHSNEDIKLLETILWKDF